jgi:hypothetical protein
MVQWQGSQRGQVSLLDILDKVLDKGLVVAGDIRVSLANVELLTIKVRLLVCSIDKAQEIGLDWWRYDGFLTGETHRMAQALQTRVEALERQLPSSQAPTPANQSAGTRRGASRRKQTRKKSQ